MIAPVILLFQLAGGEALHVRAGGATEPVGISTTASGGRVRVDALASALGGRAQTLPTGWTRLAVQDIELDVSPGIPFARVGSVVYPLAAAPSMAGGALLIPLQIATELLPRLETTLRYDASRRELALVPRGTSIATSSGGAVTSAPPRATAARPPVADADRQRVVVVDAGHGGKDPGTSGLAGRRRVFEKDIALAVALAVRDSLTRRGVRVVLTRDDDTFIPLADRGRFANQHQGDLFLSIHVNAANPRARDRALVRGFETYFLAEAKTEDAKRVEEMENEVVRFETGADAPKDDPLSFIIHDMAQNEHLRESSDLAEVVQQRLARMHPGPNRGVKQANFAVLRTTFMPAVLIEIGFATNATDAAYIASATRQRELAGAIAAATMEYLEHYERRVGGRSR